MCSRRASPTPTRCPWHAKMASTASPATCQRRRAPGRCRCDTGRMCCRMRAEPRSNCMHAAQLSFQQPEQRCLPLRVLPHSNRAAAAQVSVLPATSTSRCTLSETLRAVSVVLAPQQPCVCWPLPNACSLPTALRSCALHRPGCCSRTRVCAERRRHTPHVPAARTRRRREPSHRCVHHSTRATHGGLLRRTCAQAAAVAALSTFAHCPACPPCRLHRWRHAAERPGRRIPISC